MYVYIYIVVYNNIYNILQYTEYIPDWDDLYRCPMLFYVVYLLPNVHLHVYFPDV